MKHKILKKRYFKFIIQENLPLTLRSNHVTILSEFIGEENFTECTKRTEKRQSRIYPREPPRKWGSSLRRMVHANGVIFFLMEIRDNNLDIEINNNVHHAVRREHGNCI